MPQETRARSKASIAKRKSDFTPEEWKRRKELKRLRAGARACAKEGRHIWQMFVTDYKQCHRCGLFTDKFATVTTYKNYEIPESFFRDWLTLFPRDAAFDLFIERKPNWRMAVVKNGTITRYKYQNMVVISGTIKIAPPIKDQATRS